MSDEQYLHDSDRFSSKIRFRKMFLLLLILSLAASITAGIVLIGQQRKKAETVESYYQAVENRNFDEAMDIYRRVKERALSNDVSQNQREVYSQTLQLIEADIEQQLADLFDALQEGQDIKPQQLAFAEGMAEIAGVHLIGYIRQQCRQYLFAEINLQVLRYRIDPLLNLANVQPVLSDIPQQLPDMTRAVPVFSFTERKLQSSDWYGALAGWNEILNQGDFGSFVLDLAFERRAETLNRMYEPLIQEAETTLLNGRFVTAYEKLTQLAEIFPEDSSIQYYLQECEPYVPAELTIWGEYNLVEILTIRPLILDESVAFDGDTYESAANDAMLTAAEFRNMLNELRRNDYVLVDLFRLYDAEGRMREFTVPQGKKPLVLVIDSLNYYVTRRETGNAWNLELDESGKVRTVFKKNGEDVGRHDAEAIAILDDFVARHPDFSYDGAKGVISLTGYECVFGYVVSEEQAAVRNAALSEHNHLQENFSPEEIARQKAQAAAVAQRLKETGWTFASSTYGNINLRDSSLETIAEDTAKWLEQVGSIVGPVDMLNYPQGAFLSGNNAGLEHLKENGFRFFAGQGTTAYRIQGTGYIYADKLPVNGYVLRQPQGYQLDRLFDTSAVYDPNKRPQTGG